MISGLAVKGNECIAFAIVVGLIKSISSLVELVENEQESNSVGYTKHIKNDFLR